MTYLATYVTVADADACLCDFKYIHELQFQLIVTAYSAIIDRDLANVLLRVTDQLVPELDDDDPDMPPVSIRHAPDHELNSPDCLMFVAHRLHEPVADLIVRRINV